MSILPTWPIAAGALALGIAGGAYVDHKVMQGRIDKIQIAHTEQLRVREVQRAKDEVAARESERLLAVRAGQIEQEKVNAIAAVRSDADALIARLRKQAASKSANPSGVPTAGPACQSAAGGELSDSGREDIVRLAERADQQRAALGACYQAYDSIGAQGTKSSSEP